MVGEDEQEGFGVGLDDGWAMDMSTGRRAMVMAVFQFICLFITLVSSWYRFWLVSYLYIVCFPCLYCVHSITFNQSIYIPPSHGYYILKPPP